MKKHREKYRREEGEWEKEKKGSNYAAVSIFLLTHNGNFNWHNAECWDNYRITDGAINEKKDMIKEFQEQSQDFWRYSTKFFFQKVGRYSGKEIKSDTPTYKTQFYCHIRYIRSHLTMIALKLEYCCTLNCAAITNDANMWKIRKNNFTQLRGVLTMM
jgi:hypothetical protein